MLDAPVGPSKPAPKPWLPEFIDFADSNRPFAFQKLPVHPTRIPMHIASKVPLAWQTN
jgi:hypothetical protein